MYVLTDPSLGEDNTDKCRHIQDFAKVLELQISVKCDQFIKDEKELKAVARQIIREINKNCKCGLTQLHLVRKFDFNLALLSLACDHSL